MKHGSDAKAYKILDSLRGTLQPRPFPVVSGTDEPILRLKEVYGAGKGAQIVRQDQIVFENYDDTEFGYPRVIVDSKQLRLEYHPASDGDAAKTPDDFVTVDLATHKMVHYQPAG